MENLNNMNTQQPYGAPQMTPPQAPMPQKKRSGHSTGALIAVALSCSLVGSMLGAGGFIAYDALFNKISSSKVTRNGVSEMVTGKRSENTLKVTTTDTGAVMTPAEIYAANVNSTVGITTSVTTNFFGYRTTQAASGSGFVLTSDGYIVTNYHVVASANDIKVTTFDNTSYNAILVGYDINNDIAVLKIDASDLKPVVVGDSSNMNVGDDVVAIGNPLGELTFSLTKGIVSALDRQITINKTAMNLIQTDCAINAGNSGGALFNDHGEVIGITNAKISGNGYTGEASVDNVGFAIPINSVLDMITDMIETGTVTRPYIGVNVYDPEAGYRISGSIVDSVVEDGPADKAGVRAGDLITAVNGKEISGTAEFVAIIGGIKEGDDITLTIQRNGKEIELDVTPVMKETSAIPDTSSSNSNSRKSRSSDEDDDKDFSRGWGGLIG